MTNNRVLYIVIGCLGTLVAVLGIYLVMQAQHNTVSLTVDIPKDFMDIDNTYQLLAQAKDSQRRSDVNTILNAIYQYAIDHDPSFLNTIPEDRTMICSKASCPPYQGKESVDLSVLVGEYLVGIPTDPNTGDEVFTGYFISKSGEDITVFAPSAEATGEITVTR